MQRYLRKVLFLFLLECFFGSRIYGQENIKVDSTAVTSKTDTAVVQSGDSVAVQSASISLSGQPGEVKKKVPPYNSWKISRGEMNGLVVRETIDIVQIVPPVSGLNLGNPGQSNSLIFHGGKPQQSRILLDDMVIEDVISGNLSSIALPFQVIDTLSYRSGNSTGNGDIADALILKSKRISGNSPYSSVRYMAGDWNYSDLNVIFALPLSARTDLLVTGGRQKYGGFLGQDREIGNSRLFGTFRHRLKKNLALTFLTLRNKNKAAIPGHLAPDFAQQVSSPSKHENRMDDRLALKYENSTAGYGLDVNVAISRVHQQSFDSNETLFDNRSTVTGLVVQNTFRRNKSEYRIGGKFQLIRIGSGQIPDLEDDFKRGYVGACFDFTNNLKIDFLANLEKYKGYDAQFNSGLVLNYSFYESFRIRISAKKYTRYPTFTERFWPLQFYMGNNQLNPEQESSIETGLRMNIRNIAFESAVFYRSIHDWIENIYDTDQVFIFRNLESYEIAGFDFKSTWHYYETGNLGVTASFLNVNASEPVLPNSQKVIVHTYLEAGKSFFQNYVFSLIRLNGRFYSSRNGWMYSDIGRPAVVGLPSVMVWDAQLKLVFASATLTIAYENLMDKIYELMPGFIMPPRSLIIGIDWEFWD